MSGSDERKRRVTEVFSVKAVPAMVAAAVIAVGVGCGDDDDDGGGEGGGGETQELVYNLPTPPSTLFYPALVAEELGFFEEEGVSPDLAPAAEEISATAFLDNGDADVSFADVDEIILSRKRAAFDAMVTIEPEPRSTIPGANSLSVRKVLVRLDSTTAFHSSSWVRSSGVRAPKPPAKANRTSAGPSSLSTSARRRATPAGVVRSAASPTASAAPASRVREVTRSIDSGSRPQTATRARLCPNRTAVAAPMPFEPPVTTATLPSRSG
jgi:NMT1/THI5 like